MLPKALFPKLDSFRPCCLKFEAMLHWVCGHVALRLCKSPYLLGQVALIIPKAYGHVALGQTLKKIESLKELIEFYADSPFKKLKDGRSST